jgi:hypothetical protein
MEFSGIARQIATWNFYATDLPYFLSNCLAQI